MTKVKIGQVYKGKNFDGNMGQHAMGRVKVEGIEETLNGRYSLIRYSDVNGECTGYTDTNVTFLEYFRFDLLATFKLKIKENK